MSDRTLLLIDPKAGNWETYSALFQPYGYRVRAAATAQEGMRLALAERPSVVVTELFSRTDEGWWILEALRHNPVTTEIPIIAFTAHAMSDGRDRATLADSFLPKPCQPLRVVEEADRLCGIVRRVQASAEGYCGRG